MWPARRLLKYGLVAGATVGTLVSLKANQYNLDSIGVVRLGRAAFTVFNISVHYKKTLYRNQLDRSSKEYLELKSSVHRKAAEMLLDLCCTNRGVYIKVGQHIGALDYLVPPEYVDTMKVLHSQAPRSTIEEVYRVLREDLKQDPSEIFLHIEEDPQGAASLAQVHKATLKDGTVVAVKVQHPYVKGNSLVDMKTMEALVNLVSWVFPDFKFSWLVKESKRNIPIELDFLNEGHNAEKVSKMFSHIPWLKQQSEYRFYVFLTGPVDNNNVTLQRSRNKTAGSRTHRHDRTVHDVILVAISRPILNENQSDSLMMADGNCHHLCKLMEPVDTGRASVMSLLKFPNTMMPSDCSVLRFGMWSMLGTCLTSNNEIHTEVETRFGAANRAYYALLPILRSQMVPRVYWDLSTSRVLTMEYVEGGQVNDLAYIRANKIDPYEVADKLSQLYSQMIFIHGFVHSDPHPGNILVKKIPKKGLEIILLDHGLYADLSNDFRWEYSKLWFSILNKDKEGMRQHSQNLGVGNLYFLLACMVTGRTWDSIMAGIEKTKWSISEVMFVLLKAQRDKEIPHLLPQISDVLDSINRQMLLILRTNDLMRGVEFTLKAQNRKTSFLVMSRCVIRSVYGERLKLCKTWMSRCRTVMSQQWALFKLSMYYTYLSVLSLPIPDTTCPVKSNRRDDWYLGSSKSPIV
ncbi:hypothetical protein ANN_11370 [Periplaneta americana]|uniref:ABC1 atypical kinase-like domain-containing protein n=1 Tax=Periplaneta americana TaxID=6978 RepID=A0ABQ8T663_PERAM|nr:hypothetical protein ANN_11370 [Periplaneta americana]